MRRALVTVACVSALAACGSTSTSSPAGTSAAATPTAAAVSCGSTSTSSGSMVSTGTTSLGTVLIDTTGCTVYRFAPEKNGAIGACSASCLGVWPPVLATGTPTAASGVSGALGVVAITYNGAQVQEVTYNTWPLHRYSGDSAAGQATGNGFGGVWFAVTPTTTSADSTGSGSAPTLPAATPTVPAYTYPAYPGG